jgi:hypothetical protein
VLRGIATARFPIAKLDGNDEGRVLKILHGARIHSLVLRDGRAQWGGAIYGRGGRVRLDGRTRIRGSQAALGGGISVTRGRLIVTGETIVLHNHARTSGGGIYVRIPAGLVVRDDAQIRANRSGDYGGGIAVNIGTMTLRGRASVRFNESTVGGGIANLDGWTWFRNRARVTQNVAEEAGGGVYVEYGSGGVCSQHVRLSPNVPDDPPFEDVGC